MDITLNDIIQHYLDDEKWQTRVHAVAVKRDPTLPELGSISRNFARGETNLRTCRDQIDAITRKQESWGLQGRGFMGTLGLFVKYHDEKEPVVERFLRNTLTDLSTENMGTHLEALYLFLREEQTRLRREGKSSGQNAAPGNSALVISVFTAWLDEKHWPVIYYEGIRRGICLLYKAGLLPDINNLAVNNDTIDVKTEAHHQACLQVLNAINPVVKRNRYWPDFFFHWVRDNFQSLTKPATMLIVDEVHSFSVPQTTTTQPLKEVTPEYTLSPAETTSTNDGIISIPPGPLKHTPEPLLTELIQEVQRHILVDASTIRRIYQALLAGHVILSGPPGTGKTELARLIPEMLWRSKTKSESLSDENTDHTENETRTAYATHLVTANAEWSVRTLIGGIAPQNKNGSLTYTIQQTAAGVPCPSGMGRHVVFLVWGKSGAHIHTTKTLDIPVNMCDTR